MVFWKIPAWQRKGMAEKGMGGEETAAHALSVAHRRGRDALKRQRT